MSEFATSIKEALSSVTKLISAKAEEIETSIDVARAKIQAASKEIYDARKEANGLYAVMDEFVESLCEAKDSAENSVSNSVLLYNDLSTLAEDGLIDNYDFESFEN